MWQTPMGRSWKLPQQHTGRWCGQNRSQAAQASAACLSLAGCCAASKLQLAVRHTHRLGDDPACGQYSTNNDVLNSLDLYQSVQELCLPVQQYQHVVEPRGHRTVLRFPWLAGGSLAFLGRYATSLQCTGQQARDRGIITSFIQCPWLRCQMAGRAPSCGDSVISGKVCKKQGGLLWCIATAKQLVMMAGMASCDTVWECVDSVQERGSAALLHEIAIAQNKLLGC
jgi:hypothetical protein